MEVKITQFNVQLYFKEPVLDSEILQHAFANSDGFSSSPVAQDYGSHPMQNTMSFFRQGFRIAPVQSNVLPFRILQVMSYPNALADPDAETINCLQFVTAQLQRHLKISVENDVYAVRTVSHSIISGTPDIHRVLSKLSSIENIPSLAGKYVAHKNPMDAIQLVTRTENDLVHRSWSDIRVSQFNTSSYVVTIFNETESLALALESIKNVRQFVTTLMQEMEQASQA
ncbi:MAG: hypothetical protein ABI347_08790 [Nitrososphaera sp.]|jgi:hypothetical protein